MIDIETELFDDCVTEIEKSFPGILATSKNLDAPAEFPSVSFIEVSSTTDTNRSDSSNIEKGAVLTYDVRIYSNLRVGAKAQAKEIAQIVDEFMFANNFRRTFRSSAELPRDTSVYQVYSRYIAGITDKGKLYRR